MSMRFKSFAALTAAFAFAASSTAQPADPRPEFSRDRFRSHVEFLADDLLEGRNAGERGYDIAARYVATQLEGLGVEPGNKGDWYQQVPFVQASLIHPPTLKIGDRSFTHGKE